jgi:plasmid rolling circle replication initiator protein Rep
MIAAVEKQYPEVLSKKFANKATGEIIFVCYYLEKERVKMNAAIIDMQAVKLNLVKQQMFHN